jgi:hypothetical protein
MPAPRPQMAAPSACQLAMQDPPASEFSYSAFPQTEGGNSPPASTTRCDFSATTAPGPLSTEPRSPQCGGWLAITKPGRDRREIEGSSQTGSDAVRVRRK